ncbi:MAG: lysophospholipid acyltransferase family protein [Alteripontixanthobacter sp.]|uniref:lysophospholipid acyltransferase family protein n=1 Tax=Parasphingorhabdus sp. TaxID=2709688 RepID=UPI00329718BB
MMTAIAVLRSIIFYIVFYSGSVLFVTGSRIAREMGFRPLRKMVHGWVAWHRWCVNWLLGIRVVVEGVNASEPVLYAVRHESFFEAIDLPHLFDVPAIFAKEELFAIPVWGGSAEKYGCVPVARGDGARALRRMISAAKTYNAQGRPLVIFPEGTRVPHGERRNLQSGFAGLYKLLGLPVIPVAVDSGPLYHRIWKRSGTITYRFGEPIEPGLPRDEIERRVLDAMNALND